MHIWGNNYISFQRRLVLQSMTPSKLFGSTLKQFTRILPSLKHMKVCCQYSRREIRSLSMALVAKGVLIATARVSIGTGVD